MFQNLKIWLNIQRKKFSSARKTNVSHIQGSQLKKKNTSGTFNNIYLVLSGGGRTKFLTCHTNRQSNLFILQWVFGGLKIVYFCFSIFVQARFCETTSEAKKCTYCALCYQWYHSSFAQMLCSLHCWVFVLTTVLLKPYSAATLSSFLPFCILKVDGIPISVMKNYIWCIVIYSLYQLLPYPRESHSSHFQVLWVGCVSVVLWWVMY
jgi:hypothetical protein